MDANPKPIHPVGATDHIMELPPTSNPIGDIVRASILHDLEKEGYALVKKERVAADHPTPPPMPISAPLTQTEKSAFLGLQAQAREYERAVNEQERAIIAEVEARLGLDAGAIGSSHTVNPQTWTVAAVPQPDAQIAAAQ